jgi:hypothetical protein
MTPIDVAATVRDFRALRKHDDSYPQQVARLGDGEKHLLLAHDNQSNYLGLHMRTPYASRVFTLDHAEPSTVPTFRSVASMLNAMADCVSRQVLRPDYPVLDARIANADDRRLSLDQLNLHLSDPDKKDNEAFAAMQLSHPDDMELFCELLDSGDMWIAERMCAIVGGRRYRPAIQRMVEAAATRGGNRIVATIAALRDWPIKEARDALRTLRDRVDEGYRAYFPQT